MCEPGPAALNRKLNSTLIQLQLEFGFLMARLQPIKVAVRCCPGRERSPSIIFDSRCFKLQRPKTTLTKSIGGFDFIVREDETESEKYLVFSYLFISSLMSIFTAKYYPLLYHATFVSPLKRHFRRFRMLSLLLPCHSECCRIWRGHHAHVLWSNADWEDMDHGEFLKCQSLRVVLQVESYPSESTTMNIPAEAGHDHSKDRCVSSS